MIALKQIWSHQVPAWKNFIFSPNVKQINSKFAMQSFDNLDPTCLSTADCHPYCMCTLCSHNPDLLSVHLTLCLHHSELLCNCYFLPSIISSLCAWKSPYSLRSDSDVSTVEKSFLSLLASWPELDSSLLASMLFHLLIQQNIGGIYPCQTWSSELGKQRLTRERRTLI